MRLRLCQNKYLVDYKYSNQKKKYHCARALHTQSHITMQINNLQTVAKAIYLPYLQYKGVLLYLVASGAQSLK